jgi:type IV pilus assembly protein PilM
MTTAKTVWGIDVGQGALKALKLREQAGGVLAERFEIVKYPQILSGPGADARHLIRDALGRLAEQADLSDSHVAVSVPGWGGYCRFVHLPPVDSSRVPEVVHYEAAQQIPFPLEEVIWQWQTFRDPDAPDSPDVDAGIFALRRSDVGEMLLLFSEAGINVDAMQMAPLALYNFMTFDEQIAPEGATLLADVGADETDFVVADGRRIWTRTAHIGGNHFTEALARATGASFDEAEQSKCRIAAGGDDAGALEALQPVYVELADQLRQAVDDYVTCHAGANFGRLLTLGNCFRLPGLAEFVEDRLAVAGGQITGFNRLDLSADVDAAAFGANVLAFPVAYGLAVQALGLTAIHADFLPAGIARKADWTKQGIGGAAGHVLKKLLSRLRSRG